MDQRNTGTSFAPITAADGWPSYAADQLALMDHLGIERFAVLGMCIGGAFIMELLAEVPERIAAAVALQPIGLDGNRDAFRAMFDEWRADIADEHPEATDADWEGCWTNLFGGDDLLWSVPDGRPGRRSTRRCSCCRATTCTTRGRRRGCSPRQAPAATLIERWKDPADQPAARAAVDEFLAAHAG